MENSFVQKIIEQQQCLLKDKMRLIRQKGQRLVNDARYPNRKLGNVEWKPVYGCFVETAGQIEKMEWNHEIEQLWQAQHEAVFWRGFVEQELQNHDQACTLLEKAIEGIEKHGLQKSMPKVYAMAYLCLVRSRLEKQSESDLLRWYLSKAKSALCGMEERNASESEDDLEPYTKEMLQVEWNLQKSIVEVGMYQTEPEDRAKKEDGLFAHEKTAEHYLLEAYRTLREIPNDTAEQNYVYADWSKRQQLTLYATYGAFYKKKFFQAGGCPEEQSSSSMEADQFVCFVTAMLFYCCAAIEDDWKNTISTGSMAGLIHYCETHFSWCSEVKFLCEADKKYSALQKFLQKKIAHDQANVLNDHLGDIIRPVLDYKEKNIPETEEMCRNETYDAKAVYSEVLKYIYNCFRPLSSEEEKEKKGRMSGISLMNQLLTKTLEIDRCNMFALSLQAAILKIKKGEISNKGAGEVELYPAMRQAALRKHFKDIGSILDEIGEKEALLPFMLDLIDLYNAAVNYMDKASAFTSQSKESDSKEEVLLVGHYTRLSVIPKLIRADSCGRFRLQNVRYLNDPSEGKVMMRYIEKAWKDKKEQDGSASGSELFQSLIELYHSEEGRAGGSPRRSLRSSIYIGCFSDRLDQLNMWSRYGDEGKGCCLVIDATKSFDRSSRTVLENLSIEEVDNHYHLDQNHYPLYRTIYLPGDAQTATMDEIERYNKQRSRAPEEMYGKKDNQHFDRERTWWEKQEDLAKAFKDFVNEATESMKSLETHYNDLLNTLLKEENKRETKEQLEELKRELLHTEMVIFDLVRFLVKDDRYRDEREYRVIQYSHEPKVSEIVPNEKGPASGIPRLYVEIEKNISYQYVCLGPLVQNFSAEAAYLANLHRIQHEGGKRTNKRDGIPVQQSMIPYCI